MLGVSACALPDCYNSDTGLVIFDNDIVISYDPSMAIFIDWQ